MSFSNGNLIKQLNTNEIIDRSSVQQSLHQSNVEIYEYVELIYEMIIRKLRTEKTFNNVWIIRTFPDERLRTRWSSLDTTLSI